MPIFHNNDGKLKKLGLLPLDKEKALQKLIEDNLFEVLDMRLLASEYQTNDGRIDTLAIDSNGAPVIIEYKRSKNSTVINQALFYLAWLKEQRVEFFRELVKNKLTVENVTIDWHNPRVICVAESYNKFDIPAFKKNHYRLELYKFHLYENGIFVLDKVNGDDNKVGDNLNNSATITNFMDSEVNILDLSEENAHDLKIEAINLGNQLKVAQPVIKNLFKDLKKRISELDENIGTKINTKNIAFRISKIFAEIKIQKDNILIYLREVEHDYPNTVVQKLTHGWGKKNLSVRIRTVEELDYIMPLIEQSYRDVL